MNAEVNKFSGRRIHPDHLQHFAVRILEACGLSQAHAAETAEVLVKVDAWGVFTHGTRQLLPFIKNLRSGAIRADAVPEVIFAQGGQALVDGHQSMPMVTSRLAMHTAIELARTAGIAYAGVRHSNHFGAAGYYAMMAAEADMIGIAMSNVDACMTVPGASGAVIGSNPIAYAVPAGKENPVFFDIATSVVAVSKIFAAKASGAAIPENWLADKQGRSTTNPNDYPEHATILPMAGHKGYGLALLIEILGGVLTGSAFLSGVKCWVNENPEPADQGHAFLAIDVKKLMPVDAFKERVDALITEVRSAPKSGGGDGRIYLPGEMEWERRKQAYACGLSLPDNVLQNLVVAAAEAGLADALEDAFAASQAVSG